MPKNGVMRSLKPSFCDSLSTDGSTRVFRSLGQSYEIAEMAKYMFNVQSLRQIFAYSLN